MVSRGARGDAPSSGTTPAGPLRAPGNQSPRQPLRVTGCLSSTPRDRRTTTVVCPNTARGWLPRQRRDRSASSTASCRSHNSPSFNARCDVGSTSKRSPAQSARHGSHRRGLASLVVPANRGLGLGTGRVVEANSDHGRLAASRRARTVPVFELCGARFDFVNAPTDLLTPGSGRIGVLGLQPVEQLMGDARAVVLAADVA